MKEMLLLLIALISIPTASARAEEYYVELGRAASEAEAKTLWAELQAKHKTLADYDVYPNQILQPGGGVAYRVQAGPMLDKPEAQRVCKRLFRRNVACFVIEGFDPKTTQSFDASADAAPAPAISSWDFMPWQTRAPVNVNAPPEPAAMPEVAEAKPASKAKTKAKVDVAEAIAVPVTESNEVTVGEPIVLSSDAAPPAPMESPGWLSVQPFLDEARAQTFWSELRKHAPRQTGSLSMRVIHPLVSHDVPKVIAALGTFDSEKIALEFCRDYITPSSYLECQFSAQPPQGEAAHQERWWQRLGTPERTEDEASLFWGEVLNEKTQDKALEKWERIRTDHDALLVNVRSQITPSLTQPNRYVVRIGPLKSKQKTQALCNALKARKVDCRLVTL